MVIGGDGARTPGSGHTERRYAGLTTPRPSRHSIAGVQECARRLRSTDNGYDVMRVFDSYLGGIASDAAFLKSATWPWMRSTTGRRTFGWPSHW